MRSNSWWEEVTGIWPQGPPDAIGGLQISSLLLARGEPQVAVQHFLPANHIELEWLTPVDQACLIEDVAHIFGPDRLPDVQADEDVSLLDAVFSSRAAGPHVDDPHSTTVAATKRFELRRGGLLQFEAEHLPAAGGQRVFGGADFRAGRIG